MAFEQQQQQQQKNQPSGDTGPKKSWKETLNLPRTTFPMRAGLVQNEPASEKRWRTGNLYAALRKARTDPHDKANLGRWVFHDGPPYANGSIHLGHLLNKTLKDFVVRTKSLQGFDVPYIPGWDCHGLPIEHKVMTEMVESGKAAKLETLSNDDRRMAIRRECRKYAEKYIKLQTGQMQRLLTLADYDHPYLTMQPEYEAGTLSVFADLVEQGLVYRALKPVHWSIANQTALAEAELEYYDREDTSVYVWFEVEDVAGLLKSFGMEDNDPKEFADLRPAFMIWTTTPWTLPANLAVAVHPKYRYVLAMLSGRPTVIAQALYEDVRRLRHKQADAGVRHGSGVLGECDGNDLIGLTYRHPFCARVSPVVAAEYVTLEDGTGLVHTAPGHGTDDYHTGMRNGLEIYCPVRFDGTYDDTVPDWLRGKLVWDANPLVVEHLRTGGHLYFNHKFTHSYPHDWRGKSPVIFRATKQWFIAVDKGTAREGRTVRDLALEQANSRVKFFPEWGRNRMVGMLESRPDWCLSRQRAWGLPIPAFFDEKSGGQHYLLTRRSIECVRDKVAKGGSDVWFQSSPAQLLEGYDPASDPEAPEWIKAQGLPSSKAQGLPSLGFEGLIKSSDIFDVWFESGSSWHSVIRLRQGAQDVPAQLYLEGSDQHRGWFQVSLLTALGATGQAPFKGLLTHGFTVDKDGRKMSKSLGNTLEVEDLLKEYGADVCRWWVASLNFEGDMKIDKSFFDVAGESYRKVRNTLRFLLSNLDDYVPSTPDNPDGGYCKPTESFPSTGIDAWALSEYNRLAARVLAAYDKYDFKAAQSALYDFCNDTLSAIYLAATKDRLYCDRADSGRRRRTQNTMWELLEGLCRLLDPLLPHTADEAWRALWKVTDHSQSIHLRTLDGYDKVKVNADAGWPKAMKLRDEALLVLEAARAAGAVENPLDAQVSVADDREGTLAGMCERAAREGVDFVSEFADLLGVSRVEFVTSKDKAKVVSLLYQPRCARSWKRDATVKERSDGSMLSDRDAQAVGL